MISEYGQDITAKADKSSMTKTNHPAIAEDQIKAWGGNRKIIIRVKNLM